MEQKWQYGLFQQRARDFLPAPILEMEFPQICRYHRADPKVLVWPGKPLKCGVGIPLGVCGRAGSPVTEALGRTLQRQETELSLEDKQLRKSRIM